MVVVCALLCSVSIRRFYQRPDSCWEGHLRQSLWFKGRWADEYLYAILGEEWLTKRGGA